MSDEILLLGVIAGIISWACVIKFILHLTKSI